MGINIPLGGNPGCIASPFVLHSASLELILPNTFLPFFTDDAESLVRTLPGEDRTNGFFVCVFVRSEDTDVPSSGGTGSKRKLEPDDDAGKRKKTKT